MVRAPLIEILTLDGCPNHEPSISLVLRVLGETGVDAAVVVVDVPDAETAQQARRVFRAETGFGGRPERALRRGR